MSLHAYNAIRTTCFILLLLPLVHLAYLVSRNTMETLDTSPEAWAREIEAYATADSGTVLPRRPIVVVGGMRVKLWRDLEQHLAPFPLLMRGLGDAIVEDIAHNYSRLIGFYQPDTVVLVLSNSEFHIRDSKSAQELVSAVEDLVALDTSYGITRRFYIITPLKTPRSPSDHAKIDLSTQLLTASPVLNERVAILNANSLLSNGQGKPWPGYFRGDGINLNEHGYLRLSMLLRAQIELDTPQPAVNTTTP